jgi:hypothetical protein
MIQAPEPWSPKIGLQCLNNSIQMFYFFPEIDNNNWDFCLSETEYIFLKLFYFISIISNIQGYKHVIEWSFLRKNEGTESKTEYICYKQNFNKETPFTVFNFFLNLWMGPISVSATLH